MLLKQAPMPAPSTKIEGARVHTLTAVPSARTVAHTPAAPASVTPRPVMTSTRPSLPISGRNTTDTTMMPTMSGPRAIAAADGPSPSAVWKNSDRP
jgi:hypothetical protein